MSVMGLKKKSLNGWVGGVNSIQVFFFNFASPRRHQINLLAVTSGEEQRDPGLQQPTGHDTDTAGQGPESGSHVGVAVDTHQDYSSQEDAPTRTHQNVRLSSHSLCLLSSFHVFCSSLKFAVLSCLYAIFICVSL